MRTRKEPVVLYYPWVEVERTSARGIVYKTLERSKKPEEKPRYRTQAEVLGLPPLEEIVDPLTGRSRWRRVL